MSEPSDLIVPAMRPTAELKLFAKDGDSMKRSQESLTTWCRGKIEETRQEWHDAKEITATALHAGFRVDTHRRAAARVEKRLQMLEKMLVAFEAGFMLVPNMDCDVFAIRTDKTKPTPKTADWQSGIADELMGTLPAGEGQYINPSQTVESDSTKRRITKAS